MSSPGVTMGWNSKNLVIYTYTLYVEKSLALCSKVLKRHKTLVISCIKLGRKLVKKRIMAQITVSIILHTYRDSQTNVILVSSFHLQTYTYILSNIKVIKLWLVYSYINQNGV